MIPELDFKIEKITIKPRKRKLKGNWRIKNFPCGCMVLYDADHPKNKNMEKKTHKQLFPEGHQHSFHSVEAEKELINILHKDILEEKL